MAGLRARQKHDRNRRIVEAAARLFREVGFERLKIETIAEAAGLSVGTIYNYYEGKGDVLIAVVSLEVNEVIAAGEAVLNRRWPEATTAIDALFGIYLRHSLHYLSKEMWRAAMSMSILHPDARLSRHYRDLDAQLCDQVCRLVGHLDGQGLIPRRTGSANLGRILFNTMNQSFMNFVTDEAVPVEALIEDVASQTATLMALAAAPLAGGISAPGPSPARARSSGAG